MTYDAFIASKLKHERSHGFEPVLPLNQMLFDWQQKLVDWAVKQGRCALFEDCGLGKTPQQLEWARQVVAKTGGSVLIVCPLAVAEQTEREASKFGISAKHIYEPEQITGAGIYIINYERVEKFDTTQFSGVVLDESSILKAFTGKTRHTLNRAFAQTPYKLCCTATPSPNDFTELGQHADFLGICSPNEMLATYFINDTFDTGTWRLKGHAEESFWKWVSSWAACVSKPSDIGGSDKGFDLPPVKTHIISVAVDHRADPESGELFRNPRASATALHAENRRTITERVEAAAAIVNKSRKAFVVWCETNDESEMLTKLIHDAVEVTGSEPAESKARKLLAFSAGESRVIVTKGKIARFGLNWQHCHQDIFVSLSHSWETFYQCCKRTHRFGQTKTIHRYIIQTDADTGVMDSITRKQQQFETMQELVKFTAETLTAPKEFITMKTDIDCQSSPSWTIYHGDCVRVAREKIASDSVGFSIFSPPFADLFTYSADVQDMGNCRNLDEFMEQFGYLIDELGRITIPGRECAVHCCDLLATKWKDGDIELKDFSTRIATAFREREWLFHSRITIWKSPVTEMQRTKAHGLLYKTLQSDSSKSRVGVPDYLLVFKKRGENPKPITHTPQDFPLDLWQEIASPVWMTVDQGRTLNGEAARNDRDERHICPLQLDVIDRALHLWSAPGDLVFSPFAGIGSEGYSALKMNRKFVGAELKESYFHEAVYNLKRGEEESIDLFNTTSA